MYEIQVLWFFSQEKCYKCNGSLKISLIAHGIRPATFFCQDYYYLFEMCFFVFCFYVIWRVYMLEMLLWVLWFYNWSYICFLCCQFLFDAAAAHCAEIATHRHGCCVLQRCVDFSTGAQRQRLVAEIAANALFLSQDPFG